MVEQRFLIGAAQVKACRRVPTVVLRVSYSGIYFGPHPLFSTVVFTSMIGWFCSSHLPSGFHGAGGGSDLR